MSNNFRDANIDFPDYFHKLLSMKAWSAKQDVVSLREEPSRDIWLMHPAIVNAWYSPNHNTISITGNTLPIKIHFVFSAFPAGILQPPFFKGGWPRYLNFGAIGMVIGHEITHGFDDQGRQYDGTGNASPWWSDSTIQNFAVEAQCFIDQYGNYTVPELIDVLGEEDAHVTTNVERVFDLSLLF